MEVVNRDAALLGLSWIIDSGGAGGVHWQQACGCVAFAFYNG